MRLQSVTQLLVCHFRLYHYPFCVSACWPLDRTDGISLILFNMKDRSVSDETNAVPLFEISTCGMPKVAKSERTIFVAAEVDFVSTDLTFLTSDGITKSVPYNKQSWCVDSS